MRISPLQKAFTQKKLILNMADEKEYKITHHEPSLTDKIENALGDHCLDGKVTG